ncbi:uncharacterized protein LOC114577681 isoform X10 [Apis cerana]|uniref:uncharacterized protein LOC114577681 isoform X10 n=1 Tax=Apis cerana TaxID=7461 RepID=UPI002B23190E|nr:uncharacterized protein LOC114577681 isoform X10 [Apis cerana]
MLLCTKFPVTSNGGISEARGATNRVDHWRLEGDSSVSPAPKQRCDETTLLAKEIREWRCGTGSRARRNVRVSEIDLIAPSARKYGSGTIKKNSSESSHSFLDAT